MDLRQTAQFPAQSEQYDHVGKSQAKNGRALNQGRKFNQWPHGNAQSWPRCLPQKRHQNGLATH